MATLGSRRGFAEKFSLPLMLLAFVLVGGFLYWLNITAEPTEVAIAEEVEERGSTASSILSLDDFLANPEGQVDATVEVTGARVASLLGTQAFWIGPDDAPYLVKLSPELVEAGTEMVPGAMVSVIGTVYMMSDSVLTAWDALGAFGNQGDRIVAEFATSFLEASDVREQGGGAPDGAGS